MKGKDGESLVPVGPRDLALVANANPLVSRGLADLARQPEEPADSRRTHLKKIHEAVASKDFDGALRLLGEAIHDDPDDAFAYLFRGRIWLALARLGSKTFDREKMVATPSPSTRWHLPPPS